MSLYSQLFSENKDATAILGFAGLTREMFPRYRDVFLADKGDTVIVYTRVGGGNRETYQTDIDEIITHTQYIDNYDDEKDNTYAYFKFNVLPEYLHTAKTIFTEEPLSVWDMFERHMKRAKDPNSPEHKIDMEIADKLMKTLESPSKGGILFI